MDRQKQTAILFFSRSAGDEIEHKSWLAQKDSDYLIAQKLIQTSRKKLEKAGLPVFYFGGDNQTGNTFGERLASAFQEVFDMGYAAVIAVGNDCSGLSDIHWNELTAQLTAGRNVLGPDFRNGVYLIGLTRSSFNKKAFASLPWQSRQLFDALTAHCQNPVLLERRRDINTRFDLAIVTKTNPALRQLIRLLTLSTSSFKQTSCVVISFFSPSPKSLRAPPCFY